MPKFKVKVTRDASVTFVATVEEPDITHVMKHLRRHGYSGPIIGEWEQEDPKVFDNVEHYEIEDKDGNTVLED